jgi:hypothetical protein
MMETKIFDVLNGKYEEQARALREVLCDGGAKSYDHYRELCGTIRGLLTAQSEIGDLVRRLKENDDD